MSIVPVRCTQCRAALSINTEAEIIVCEYCRTSFIVKQILNQSVSPNQDVRQASEQENRDAFEIYDNVLVKYHGNKKDVVIPFGVTEIAPGAFQLNDEITSVVIPTSVQRIGYKTKGLKSSFSVYAFGACKNLRRVNIPDSVTGIKKHAFVGCKNLQEVIASDYILATLGTGLLEAFYSSNRKLEEDLKKRSIAAGGSIKK